MNVIPACLRDRPQWVNWKYVERNEKLTKAPVNPLTGGLGDSTDPATWGTYEQAVEASSKQGLAGVGFVFTADDPYCGVDLDDCIDAEGQLKDWGRELLDKLDSYSEISPSGTGVKTFVKANKPGSRCCKGYHDGKIEIYDQKRFFTVTGRRLEDRPADVKLRQESLEDVYRTVFGEEGIEPAASLPEDGIELVASLPGDFTLDDDEIVRLASKQRRTGGKFSSLWSGDWNGQFNSASEADSSLVFTLAFYTKDHAQIDRLFRSSGLMRPKWDEKHGERTYGDMTIDKALATVTKQYAPRGRHTSSRCSALAARLAKDRDRRHPAERSDRPSAGGSGQRQQTSLRVRAHRLRDARHEGRKRRPQDRAVRSRPHALSALGSRQLLLATQGRRR